MDARSSPSSDDELDDRQLYNEFEQTCASVLALYRAPGWRAFQQSALHSTQLYKAGAEAAKRAYEKGVHKGRRQLARELLTLKLYAANKNDPELLQLLQKYAQLPAEHVIHQRGLQQQADGGAHQAVSLIQQALNPSNASPTSTPGLRPSELTAFLHNQVSRHRKRAHSPMDSSSAPPNQHFHKRKRF